MFLYHFLVEFKNLHLNNSVYILCINSLSDMMFEAILFLALDYPPQFY